MADYSSSTVTLAIVMNTGQFTGATVTDPIFMQLKREAGPTITGPLDFHPSIANSSVAYSELFFDLTVSSSPTINETLAFAPRPAFKAIRGPQIADSPFGVSTDHLPNPTLTADPLGRRKMADGFIDAATANTIFAANSIDAIMASKLPDRALSMSKLQQGATERIATPDKSKFVASATSGDGADTGLVIVGSPAPGGYVAVIVNGLFREVGNGVTTRDCYFSPDGTAIRAYGAVQTGDKLYWNGIIAGADLQTTDRVDFLYVYTSF